MEGFEIPVNIKTELEKRITDAFSIFDHHGNKTVDVREIGTILRFLGCAPTEQEVNEVIAATEFEDTKDTIHLSRFMPHVCQLLAERKLEPASPEKLLEAFHVLDPEQKGYLNKDEFCKLMMEEGEPFTKEELDEMLAVAVDLNTGTIPYEYYLNQLMYEPKNSIYDLVEKFEQEKSALISTDKLSKFQLSSTINRFP